MKTGVLADDGRGLYTQRSASLPVFLTGRICPGVETVNTLGFRGYGREKQQVLADLRVFPGRFIRLHMTDDLSLYVILIFPS